MRLQCKILSSENRINTCVSNDAQNFDLVFVKTNCLMKRIFHVSKKIFRNIIVSNSKQQVIELNFLLYRMYSGLH